ncbi:tRNA lysidine(34) synthetase TilS [Spiroplasma floricola]|uniref:tRNA(Ile)-lysidine synthase n=1 Tax=Spiroplasma floricola 23-6 TaxID=1336749 RepID=A0A2K8SCN6_9MOLU|nr:tRNA lysidine(34) synthetase TilS [Spiroplasma floricola]AUB31075.1 tRNA(Ile)-lysidine synthase [Spiroplasma floricola 23-6]
MIKLLEQNKKYILGLSGGPDSVFLFYYLLDRGIKNFIACHVNYNFRTDSNKDLALVKKMCEKNNIKLIFKNINQNYSELNQNFESWARKIRYDFFCKELEKNGAQAILIAHNLNDHIETYLMQTQNNKKVSFYGIRAESIYENKKIIRPIISYKKSFILKYLKSQNISYIIDSTNSDIKYERNKIRKNLSEKSFDNFIKEIDLKNEKIKEYNIKIDLLLNSKELDLLNLNNNEEWNEYLIFRFLEYNGLNVEIYCSKKSFIKEIIKQLKSNKSFIEISKGNFILMKDYNKFKIINKKEINIFELSDFEDENFKKFLIDNNINENSNIIITNNWKKYQSKLYVNDKLLSKIYKNKKVNYFERYKNVLIFNKTSKIVLNKIDI